MTSELPDVPGQNGETTSPQDQASKEGHDGIVASPASLEIEPTLHTADKPRYCRYMPSPWWKNWLEGFALFAGIGYAIVTFWMWRDAHDNFIVNQRAWVGVDRPVSVDSIALDAHHGGKVT